VCGGGRGEVGDGGGEETEIKTRAETVYSDHGGS
jgi:hypothetical protein